MARRQRATDQLTPTGQAICKGQNSTVVAHSYSAVLADGSHGAQCVVSGRLPGFPCPSPRGVPAQNGAASANSPEPPAKIRSIASDVSVFGRLGQEAKGGGQLDVGRPHSPVVEREGQLVRDLVWARGEHG